MRNFLTTSLLAGTLLLGGASVARAQVSFGIRIGPPPAVRVEHRPARPGRDYVWVSGYWYPEHNRYVWHAGYWTRPPYEGAHWVAPRRDNGMYYDGYWDGPRGRVDHDHAWDHGHDRDYNHFTDHHDDNDHHGDNDHH
jgi:WXXGXW repeat (2 copies)